MKIKIKSLAAEAVIIRQEERKTSGDTRTSLHLHRTLDVRREARASLLAYAYLRDKPLETLERPGSRKVNWPDVMRIAKQFGGDDFEPDTLKRWAGPEAKWPPPPLKWPPKEVAA